MEKSERRDQILSAALAVFAERGFHDTAISDIIDRAGIARGTFYLYFAGKRAVFDDILDSIFVRLLEQLQPVLIPAPFDEAQVLAQVRGNALRLVDLMLAERDACRVLFTEAGGLDEHAYAKLTSFYDRLGKWVAGALEDGIRLGIVRPCEPLVVAHSLIGLMRGLLWAWVSGLVELEAEKVADEVLAMVRWGVLAVRPPGGG